MPRTFKRIFIGAIYLVIFGAIIGGTYWYKTKPTCFDGRQNGQEEGVDCGTLACGKACSVAIKEIKIQTAEFVTAKDGISEAVMEIYNPNVGQAIADGAHTLIFEDFSGNETKRFEGNKFYIFPGQTKLIVRGNIPGIPAGSKMRIELESINWRETGDLPNAAFAVRQEALLPGIQSSYEAVVSNNSDYDFKKVDVAVVVRDSSGNLVTAVTTNIQTFLARTNRSFKVSWPFELPADAVVRTHVETNLLDDSNFIKSAGRTGELPR